MPDETVIFQLLYFSYTFVVIDIELVIALEVVSG